MYVDGKKVKNIFINNKKVKSMTINGKKESMPNMKKVNIRTEMTTSFWRQYIGHRVIIIIAGATGDPRRSYKIKIDDPNFKVRSVEHSDVSFTLHPSYKLISGTDIFSSLAITLPLDETYHSDRILWGCSVHLKTAYVSPEKTYGFSWSNIQEIYIYE